MQCSIVVAFPDHRENHQVLVKGLRMPAVTKECDKPVRHGKLQECSDGVPSKQDTASGHTNQGVHLSIISVPIDGGLRNYTIL